MALKQILDNGTEQSPYTNSHLIYDKVVITVKWESIIFSIKGTRFICYPYGKHNI